MSGSRRLLGLLVPLERAPDRRDLPGWRLLAVAALVGTAMWFMATAVSIGAEPALLPLAAAGVGALAVVGLPSVPLRRATFTVIVLGAVGLAVLGSAQGGGTGGTVAVPALLGWAAASAGAMALASARGRSARPLSTAVAAAALVCMGALLLGPWAASRFSSSQRITDAVDNLRPDRPNPAGSPLDSPNLDATGRPSPSDEVALVVEAPRPAFWRTSVLDRWDGRNWRLGDAEFRPIGAEGTVPPSDVDGTIVLAGEPQVVQGRPLRQRVQIRAPQALLLPGASTPSAVEAQVSVVQLDSGTLAAVDGPVARNTTYEVTSLQPRATAAELLAAGTRPVPASIEDRYAGRPVATARTVALARQLGAQADAAAAADGRPRSSLDVVEAIEAWLGDNVKYSLDAPLAPPDQDVVDHFLFESRQGWCEQVASSLVVLARLNGVPARLATGFTPGEYDRATQRFVVRARDAHAWAEVYAPGVGWLTYDPTSRVSPLGDQPRRDAPPTATDDVGRVLLVLAAVVAVVLLARPVARLVARAARRWRNRRRDRRALARRREGAWDQRAELELEERGRAAGRPRSPGETVTTYATVVADLVEEPELVSVGERIHRDRYSAESPGDLPRGPT
ncbi:MAG: transglutaminaseTgpA domain-containing protein [Microthrixaceae bacterium]